MSDVTKLTAERLDEIRRIRNCVPFVDTDAGVPETQKAIDDLLEALIAAARERDEFKAALTRIATEDCTYGAGIDCAEKALAACVRVAKAALAKGA
ncbi:MAG: hypothetical protein AB7I42_24050 [Bradyrhizobium sp.]|uniref:hypothetical protein n=1 Tax=Bradyrhizobium sp. TaxID=376 RepID=UPI003D0A8749